MNKRETGLICEYAAVEYLKGLGYEILERNFRYGRMAEIDIIAMKNSVLHFIEVKARSGNFLSVPSEAVDFRKMKNIKKAAAYYISISRSYDKDVNFDVLEIYFSRKEDNKIIINRINMIQNAF